MDKFYNKSNSELVAVCMFCAATKTINYQDYSKYYNHENADK